MEAAAAVAAAPRLTELSHGGGCGCKISPGVLAELLGHLSPAAGFPDLLVGSDTSDDAAVYKLNDEQAIVATTDFFMPIVDDPYDFGRIAAVNALSDVYAMGGKPIMALALVGMPINVLPHDVIARVLEGGASVCAQAGIPIAGGHSIDSVEPIYGLAALGLVHPQRIARNVGARAGDALILGKPLGVGILSAALKKNQLGADGYRAMIASTTLLNRPGSRLAALPGVHAMTDVTGFGLLGHTLELCRGARLAAHIRYDALPWIQGAREFAEAGIRTGASARNWASCSAEVELSGALPAIAQTLLTDPQTSGGLLVSCDPAAADAVLDIFHNDGFGHATLIGHMAAGEPRIIVA
ncbi:selenide, water dikinase SelD [Candidimonas nitroreducens]|uniref:Selenide, water dikinase n=1 Tax=Candidimonas nitroreducens TaxID=683354 RepID=A0A225M1Q1_9BURK|nr:selenide, water dikinase SelD [Candidimonas nitroreducens]OWT53481.1 selenide, water dikinase SelD [Candidimonas nitroreducens]